MPAGKLLAMTAEAPDSLQQMDAAQLRALAASLMVTLRDKDRKLARRSQELLSSRTLNEKLAFEIAMLRRFRFGKRGEQLPPGVQGSPLEDAVAEDLVEIQAKLAAQPAELPRIEIRHEPHDRSCTCAVS